MATVKVRGRGTVPTRPDEAIVTLEVVSVADSAADAFSEASHRAAVLDVVLDEAGVDTEARSTVGTAVQEFDEYGDSQGVRHRHRAANAVNVRLADTETVTRLLHAAVERTGANVRGPIWRVRDDAVAEAEACREAVADAKRRADAYAERLGLRVDAVVAVEDASEWPTQVPFGPVRATATADPRVYPAEFAVWAAVDVTFELVAP
jgi:uncharacterized protein YggE